MSTARRKMRSASTFSLAELCLVPPAVVMLGVARLAIRFVPFRHYGTRLGQQVALATVAEAVSDTQARRAQRIGRAVRAGAGVTPWASLCLAQAMVASFLLRRLGIPYCAYFGLAPGDGATSADPMDAHAWVRVGERNITGGQDIRRYTVVKVFQHQGRAAA